MLFGLDYRQTKVTDSTLQNTLAILKNKRIPLDPRATSSDTLAHLTNFITTLQIYAWEIPRKVVEIFLNWFKCTNYSLYDIKNISKNRTGTTIFPLYLEQYMNAKKALEEHGKYYNTTK